MAAVSIYLIAWTIAEHGMTGTLETTSLLKYDVCLSSYWLYAIQCGTSITIFVNCKKQ